MKKKTYKIIGMHCASCARTTERTLRGVAGVTEANVNYATEGCEVCFDENVTRF